MNQTGLREKLSIFMSMYARSYGERNLIGMQEAISKVESLFQSELQKIVDDLESKKITVEKPREPVRWIGTAQPALEDQGYNQAISKAIELIDRRIRG